VTKVLSASHAHLAHVEVPLFDGPSPLGQARRHKVPLSKAELPVENHHRRMCHVNLFNDFCLSKVDYFSRTIVNGAGQSSD
jgi:hypothetical protein